MTFEHLRRHCQSGPCPSDIHSIDVAVRPQGRYRRRSRSGAAVLVVIFPKEMTLIENAVVVLNHLLVEICFYTAVAFAMSTAAARNTYLKAKVYIDRIASVVLSALGLRLLLSR